MDYLCMATAVRQILWMQHMAFTMSLAGSVRILLQYWRLGEASCKELQARYWSAENALFLRRTFQDVRLAAAVYSRQL